MNIFRILKKNRLFQDFEDREINKMFDCLHGHINKYSRGRVVAEAGAPVEEIGVILEGSAVKFLRKPDGSLVNLGEMTVGDMFGEVEGYTPEKVFSTSVVLAEDSTVLYLSIPTIVKQCSNNCPHHQKLLENMLSCLAERIDLINNDAKYLKIKSMRGGAYRFDKQRRKILEDQIHARQDIQTVLRQIPATGNGNHSSGI